MRRSKFSQSFSYGNGDSAVGISVYVLKTGALINEAKTVQAGGTMQIDVAHPGELASGNICKFVSLDGETISTESVTINTVTQNASDWTIAFSAFNPNGGDSSYVTTANSEKLVCIHTHSSNLVTLYNDDEEDTLTLTNPITVPVDGMVSFFANYNDCDLYITGSSITAHYELDMPLFGGEMYGLRGKGETKVAAAGITLPKDVTHLTVTGDTNINTISGCEAGRILYVTFTGASPPTLNDGVATSANNYINSNGGYTPEQYETITLIGTQVGLYEKWCIHAVGQQFEIDALDTIPDCNLSGVSDGDVLTYNATSGDWEPSAPAGGTGETNTASNIGTAGVGVFDAKVGTDLQFKKINAGSTKITVTDDTTNDEVDIDIDVDVLSHDELADYDAAQHREINDSGTATTDLWSASKITSELGDKADSSHAHAATDITSGTLAIARGGTGQTTYPSNTVIYFNGVTLQAGAGLGELTDVKDEAYNDNDLLQFDNSNSRFHARTADEAGIVAKTGNQTIEGTKTFSQDAVFPTQQSLDVPTITDFSYATHDHSDDTGGGQLSFDDLDITGTPAEGDVVYYNPGKTGWEVEPIANLAGTYIDFADLKTKTHDHADADGGGQLGVDGLDLFISPGQIVYGEVVTNNTVIGSADDAGLVTKSGAQTVSGKTFTGTTLVLPTIATDSWFNAPHTHADILNGGPIDEHLTASQHIINPTTRVYALMITDQPIVVTKISSTIDGIGTPAVTFSIKWATTISGVSGGTLVSPSSGTISVGSGAMDEETTFNDATIPAGSVIGILVTSATTTTDLVVSMHYYIDRS